MDYASVKEWLDILVKRFKESTKKEYLNSQIYASANIDDAILIYSGFEVVADVMGLGIKEDLFYSESLQENQYHYSFLYDGVCFTTNQKERLSRFAGRD